MLALLISQHTLIDEFSGFMICVISDTRSIQLSLLRELKIMNNQFPGEFVANFRSDNARELPDRQLLLELGIRKEEIPAYIYPSYEWES